MKKVLHPSRLVVGILSLLFLAGAGFFFVHIPSVDAIPGPAAAGPPPSGDPAATPDPAAAAAAANPATECKAGTVPCMILEAVGTVVKLILDVLGQLLIGCMFLILQVAQYNDFINSTAVKMGWAVIRDICNMFFVLFLLVIAIGTILQQQQYHYTKTLPKFLTNVLLINFSLTICGLIIDVSQVFMMTFFSAFADAGAGNLAVLLGIPNLMSASAGGQTVSGWSAVGGLMLAVVYITVALVTILMILIQLIVRIVALWFLVILSPFAFFLNTIPGLDKKGYVEKWWDSFTNFVVVGPALAFFLWLSLAVASSAALGDDGKPVESAKLAAKNLVLRELSGTKASDDENAKVWPSEGTNSEAGNPTSMLSFLLGIGLLLGGLMAAQEIASGSSKFAGSAIKTGNDFVTGRRGPVKGARDAAAQGARRMGEGVKSRVGELRNRATNAMSQRFGRERSGAGAQVSRGGTMATSPKVPQQQQSQARRPETATPTGAPSGGFRARAGASSAGAAGASASPPPREFKTFSAGDLKTSSPDQIRGSILSDIGVPSGDTADEETYNTKLGAWASGASEEDKTRFTDTLTKNMKALNVEKDAGRIGREDGYRDKAKIFHTDTFRKFQGGAPKPEEAPPKTASEPAAPLAIGAGQQQPTDFTKKLQEEQMKRTAEERSRQKVA